jgi:hypothetical protein
MLPGHWCDSGVKVVTVVFRGVTVLLQWHYLVRLREEEGARTVLLQCCYSAITVLLQRCYSVGTVLLQWSYLDRLRKEEPARTVLLHSVVNGAQIVEIHRFGESCAYDGDGNGHNVRGVTDCHGW